ncbi:Signal transduction histidine-protein kinase AtoS [Halioglobus japonicus]|nr:Signal transduction histidine-protein kinase AtoS [Halioglobus japonicus]
MSFSLAQILLFIIAYLTGLFAVAHLADRGIIPERITHHPAVYVLSLGVFAGAMASNGAISLAHEYGYNFLLYYLGVVLMFVVAALLLMPLLRLCRVYQLASLADVLTFRFRSPWVGAAVTVAMCFTLLPLLALQIQAVADSIHILAGEGAALSSGGPRHNRLALFFCVIITVFSILFGTRHVSSQHRNTGLVTAIAFESLVKLSALMILLLAAVYSIFGGFDGLQLWLLDNPQVSRSLTHTIQGNDARMLLVIFFAGAVCMPHIFHMAFAENNDSRDLRSATWGLPLYLLLLSLPVLPVAWAGIKLGHDLPLDYSGLAIGMALNSIPFSAAAFVAGLSAASATIIVTTLALANMCLNHLVLPFRPLQIERAQSIYTQLKWLRRTLIAVLILAGYIFFVTLGGKQSLTQLALVAFTGTLQFLPGIIATPYWHKANRAGLLCGLAAGLGVWCFSMLLPLAGGDHPQWLTALYAQLLGESDKLWTAVAAVSLALNTGLFILVSLLTKTSKAQRVAAEICSMDDRSRPTRQILSVYSAADFSQRLAPALGQRTAEFEVERALNELQFSSDETRPYALRRLRARIEANLSGLLGPAVAHRIIEGRIPFLPGVHADTEDIHLIERNLDQAQPQFTGLTADLDNLRRHHRETLDKLPIGACSIGSDGELLMWNQSMEQITGIAPTDVLGSLLGSIPHPWGHILEGFLRGDADTALKTEVVIDKGPSRWIGLHKTPIEEGSNSSTVIMVEDITDLEMLEEELLHNERLASIGRLAAGVAHEIGNPVTGIACLAQNLEYESDPEEIRYMAQDILKQTGRVTRIVESLMNFSHTGSQSGETKLAPTNLADCVDEAIHLLELDMEAVPAEFNNHCDREVVVLADSQKLLQVFINLLGNARDACIESDAQVHIRSIISDDMVRIDVDDNGCGIPQELQSQVFEPFYTTKEPGAGTGLGLALVFSIMDDLNGKVQITSPLSSGSNPGTRISLHLPLTTYDAMFAP